MPYYGAGDYYGAGGYYQAGGIGSFLKKAAGAVVRSFVPGGSTIMSVGSALTGGGRGSGAMLQVPPGGPIPGIGGTMQRVLPGGLSGYYNRREYTKDGRPRRRRKDGQPWGIPTMNPGNARAMRRAIRRSNRFVSLARSALANTKYGVYTRSSRGRSKKH